jgi:hypothetical protein
MDASSFVNVSISLISNALTRSGYGTPLFLSFRAAWSERVRSYASAAEVAIDFPGAGLPENLAAAAFFGQTPKPKLLKIGRCVLAPTQKYELTALVPTTKPSTTYRLRVRCGIVDQIVSFTSDGTPTDGEFAAAAVAALNAVAGKNYTAAGASSPVTVTGAAAGDFFSIEVLDRSLMACELTHTDLGIAFDLAAINAEDPDWYALDAAQMSRGMIAAAAAWVEANRKLYVPQSSDTTILTAALGAGLDAADDLKTNNLVRSGFLHWTGSEWSRLVSGLYGVCLTFLPGSETWSLKTVAGVPTDILSANESAKLLSKWGNGYVSVLGRSVTFNGGHAGVFVDVVRGRDWFQDELQAAAFLLLINSNGKLPYTNAGATALQNVLDAAFQRAINQGVINSDYVLTIPDANTQPSGDRSARLFDHVTFSANLQGAIHSIGITGSLVN